MKKDYTHICIVLDSSGSMGGVQSETKISFNNFVEEQKKIDGDVTIDVYQFASKVKKIVDFKNINDISDLMSDYRCDGWTALNDAICIAIDEVGNKLASLSEDERPEKVLFMILTDGEENYSKEFSSSDVKNKINHQTEQYKWDFLYLGANQDAFTNGRNYGFSQNRCMNFHNTAGGMSAVTDSLNRYTTMYRSIAVDASQTLGFDKKDASDS